MIKVAGAGPAGALAGARATVGKIVLASVLVGGGALATVAPDSARASTVFPCAAPASAGQMSIGVVIDVGGTAGGEATCVTVPIGATGDVVLAERARALGRVEPRTGPDPRFLCGIDGVPESTCIMDGTTELNWSYWLGRADGTTWTYSRYGMADTIRRPGDVDGWRLLTGAAKLRPRICPDGSTCPDPVTPTTTGPTISSPAPTAADRGTPSNGVTDAAPTAPRGEPATTVSGRVQPGSTPSIGPGDTVAADPAIAPPVSAAGLVDSTTGVETRVGGTSVERTDPPESDRPGGPSTTPPAGTDTHAGTDTDGSAGPWAAVGVIVLAGGFALIQARRTRLRQ